MSTPNLKTKKDLKIAYGISSPTLNKWLNSVPGLNVEKKRHLTPNDLELIYNHIGKP